MTTQENVPTEPHDIGSPAAESATTQSKALLTRAEELLRNGNLQASEAAFQKVIALSVDAAAGYYGLGVIKLRQGDSNRAILCFRKCLEFNPRNANAYYFLGEIAEKGQKDIALGFYKKALEINPDHQIARQKIAALQTNQRPIGQADSVAARTVARSPIAAAGIYEYLRADPSLLGQHTVRLIEAVDSLGPVRPRLSAWAEWIFGRISGCLLISLGVLELGKQSLLPSFVWPAVLALDVCILVWVAITIVRLKTTKFTFDKGRLQISEGIFSKSQRNIELYRVEDIELEQNFINRLTGDGTLMLFVQSGHEKRHSVKLGGIAKVDRLRKLFDDLRSLVLLFRTGAWGKGIIS